MTMKILVLTDTTEYGPEATLYPLLRALCVRDDVGGVYVADRALPQNDVFFDARAANPSAYIYVRQADAEYAHENQHSYRPIPFHTEDADAVWLRLDLASPEFLKQTANLFAGRYISNDPAGIAHTASKSFLLSLTAIMGDLMPPIALCYDAASVMRFRESCPDMVLKVLNSFGGKGVVRFRSNGKTDLHNEADVAAFLAENGACLAMAYLDHPEQSDNRVIVSDGEIVGIIGRKPQPGGWLCNLMAGGSYEAAEPDAREIEIVRRVGPVMKRMGIDLYGVDTLLNEKGERVLSELNTMNVGGPYRYELATGKPVCAALAASFVEGAKTRLAAQARSRAGRYKAMTAGRLDVVANDAENAAYGIETGNILRFERF